MAVFHENYFAFEALADEVIRNNSLQDSNGKMIFNPYLVQALFNVLYLFHPDNFTQLFPLTENERPESYSQILDVFGSIQKLSYAYLLKFE